MDYLLFFFKKHNNNKTAGYNDKLAYIIWCNLEALKIWPPSEETFLDREFVLKLFIFILNLYDSINCQLFIKLTTPCSFLYDP